jgi:dolichyl-phosphate beta-glucosyltransferase
VHLSLIIPAYNEAGRIAETLRSVEAYLDSQAYEWEVLVVDDGSSDDTAAIVEANFPRVRLMRITPNHGKGYAVRSGMQESVGEYRVFFDADASTPIEELEKLWPRFENGADVVIGSRALADSEVEVHQAWMREHMGMSFNIVLRTLGLTHFRDTQCGFKAFTAKGCDLIFSRQQIDRFAFDVEILHIASLHKLRIDEVPVRWINSPKSTVNPLMDSAGMLRDAFRIVRNASKGMYA